MNASSKDNTRGFWKGLGQKVLGWVPKSLTPFVILVLDIAAGSVMVYWLIQLFSIAQESTKGTFERPSTGFPTMEAIIVAALLVVMVVGVVLIRDSRPYSASISGRLILWLGIGLILVSLNILVLLSRM